jgi:hypothetical protein
VNILKCAYVNITAPVQSLLYICITNSSNRLRLPTHGMRDLHLATQCYWRATWPRWLHESIIYTRRQIRCYKMAGAENTIGKKVCCHTTSVCIFSLRELICFPPCPPLIPQKKKLFRRHKHEVFVAFCALNQNNLLPDATFLCYITNDEIWLQIGSRWQYVASCFYCNVSHFFCIFMVTVIN